MASRFRSRVSAPAPCAEDEARLLENCQQWPACLIEAAAANPIEAKEDGDGPAVMSSVEAATFTVQNYGMRHDNEDRTCFHQDSYRSRSLNFHLLGVMDGHDTAEASDLVSKQLCPLVGKKLKENLSVDEAYVTAMAELEELLKRNPHATAGTCVVNCLIAGRFVWCANLGDCRAALISLAAPEVDARGKETVQASGITWLSRDHKASTPSERERIQRAGGVVTDGRIEGLEPSRTLGDFDVKMQVKKRRRLNYP